MTSLEGCTKRSGRNRGRSPRNVDAKRLPGRQYLAIYTAAIVDKVLSSRQLSCHVRPRTMSWVTTASLSTAFQAGRDIMFILVFVLSADTELYYCPCCLKKSTRQLKNISPRSLSRSHCRADARLGCGHNAPYAECCCDPQGLPLSLCQPRLLSAG